MSVDLEVMKADLGRTRVVEVESRPLVDGEVRIRVGEFALTTNNITYAVFGDAMQYWNFFPTADPETWGRVPVWGFGQVTESRAACCTEGERVYGYFPMGTELIIEAGRANTTSVADLAPHRAAMATAYSRYTRIEADPIYDPAREAQQMLLYPLFFTSFVVDDFLADRSDLDVEAVVLSSASAKTSIGVAFQAQARGIATVGLTSPGNAEFVTELGVYDRVVTYDQLGASADPLVTRGAAFVDIAGNSDVRRAVHTGLGEALRYSMIVGGTHWDHTPAEPGGDVLPGPTPEFFFAPSQIAKRNTEWGAEELARRLGEAWHTYSAWTDAWLEVSRGIGRDAVRAAYLDLLGGGSSPRAGFIGSLTES